MRPFLPSRCDHELLNRLWENTAIEKKDLFLHKAALVLRFALEILERSGWK